MKPITDSLASLLNAQASRELGNSILYRHFASWAHVRGLKNIAKFFQGESDGELGHAKMLTDLLNDGNVQIAFTDIPQKPYDLRDCKTISELYADAEVETTDHLDDIYRAAEAEGNVGVSNMIQSMLQEQVEEQGLTERFKALVEQANGNLLLLDLMLND